MPSRNVAGKKVEPSPIYFWTRGLHSLILYVVGVLLFFALISYRAEDVPIHFLGFEFLGTFATGNHSATDHNLIGRIGTLLGFIQLQVLGAAAYLLPLTMIWVATTRIIMNERWRPRILIGFGVGLFAAASLLGAAQIPFRAWAQDYGVAGGSGGVIGYGFGYLIFRKLFSVAGSVVILGAIYLCSMVLLLGIHPIDFIKKVKKEFDNWQERRKMANGATRTPRTPAKKRKTSSAKGDIASILEGLDIQGELDLNEPLEQSPQSKGDDTPAPQIIDASHRRKEQDVGEKPFEGNHLGISTGGFEDYELPGFDLLAVEEDEGPETDHSVQLLSTQRKIIDSLQAFGVEVSAGDITRGPTITRYEVYPSHGLRVSRITQLEADIARATCAERINILAPIPGKDTVGIEIANNERVPVTLRELLTSPLFRSSKKKIPLALGKDVYGNAVIGDLAAMPHLLVAGATGSGKSVCINSIITSILYKFSPDQLRFIMIDPKVVEMQIYAKLPHLVVPVVTDVRKVVGALNWCVNEMERRYRIFAEVGVRNFDGFNNRRRPEEEKEEIEESPPEPPTSEAPTAPPDLMDIVNNITVEEEPAQEEELDRERIESIARALEDGDIAPPAKNGMDEDELDQYADDTEDIPDRLPYIVIIIDELADLMQTAPADVEMAIARIAQKARAAGIHLIIATQTPRADVVTGIIKANIPSRIAFQVSSQLDSRVILDSKGAEKLIGQGDMLFLPPGSAKLERSQGAFVSDMEVQDLVAFCSNQTEQQFEKSVQKSIESGGALDEEDDDVVTPQDEEILKKCLEVVKAEQKASTSLLQRRLRLGYTRAARMMDILEQRGYIGPGEGAKAREVFVGVE